MFKLQSSNNYRLCICIHACTHGKNRPGWPDRISRLLAAHRGELLFCVRGKSVVSSFEIPCRVIWSYKSIKIPRFPDECSKKKRFTDECVSVRWQRLRKEIISGEFVCGRVLLNTASAIYVLCNDRVQFSFSRHVRTCMHAPVCVGFSIEMARVAPCFSDIPWVVLWHACRVFPWDQCMVTSLEL